MMKDEYTMNASHAVTNSTLHSRMNGDGIVMRGHVVYLIYFAYSLHTTRYNKIIIIISHLHSYTLI